MNHLIRCPHELFRLSGLKFVCSAKQEPVFEVTRLELFLKSQKEPLFCLSAVRSSNLVLSLNRLSHEIEMQVGFAFVEVSSFITSEQEPEGQLSCVMQ